MRVDKELNAADAMYEVISDYAWPVFLLQALLVSLSIYAYLTDSLGTAASLSIAGSALMLRTRKTEKVLIIDGLGVQTSQHGFIRYLSDHDTFYAKNVIRACVINEIFEGFTLNYVIQLIQHGKYDLSQVFPTLRPKLIVLQEIWQRLNEI